MRLESLRLIRYGPFEDLSLALDPTPGRLNLICAPNGAGKSVLRQAFQDLLFGIGGQTPMGFRFGYPGMRLLATAVTSDGRHIFGRRKGHGNTWTDADGATIDKPAVAAAFDRTDPGALERLFALDTERLRRGGDELLTEGGAVADALLAGSGLSGVRAVRWNLERHADDLAPQRRSASRPFYQAVDAFVAARRAATAALLRPDAWVRLEQEVETAEAALEEHRLRAAHAAAEAARLQRIRRVRVPLAEHDAADAWLAEHPDAPDLPPSLAPRLVQTRQLLAIARQKEQTEIGRHATLVAAQQAIDVDEIVLGEAAAIDKLAEMAGQVGKALADIPRLESERTQLRAHITQLLQRLGSDLPMDAATRLVPTRASEARARALISQHESREAALIVAEERLSECARGIAEKQSALGELPMAADIAELAGLVGEIQAQGNPVAQAEESADALARSQAALAAALAQVPAWQGTAAELQALNLLPEGAYDRAHRAVVDAESELVRQNDLLAAARARHAQATETLISLKDADEIPDRAAVVSARQARDELYGIIALLAFGVGSPAPEDIARLTSGVPLALVYEQAVARADRLADRQAEESKLIGRAHEAARHLRDAEHVRGAAEATNAEAAVRANTLRAAWEAILPTCLPRSAKLDDVRAFVAARARVIERRAEVETASARASRLAERHAAWSRSLAASLNVPAAALATLLASAEKRVASALRVGQERKSLKDALADLAKTHTTAIAARDKAATALAVWRADWVAALAALHRPPDETPAVTAEVLGLLADLEREAQHDAALADRIVGMQRENAEFVSGVASLARRLHAPADDGDSLTMLASVRALRDRMAEHRDRESRRAALAQQAEQAAFVLADLARASRAREAELNDVLNACGASDADSAEQVLAAAATRAEQMANRERTRSLLLVDGDGMSLSDLRALVATMPADSVLATLAAVEAEAAAANAAAQTANGALVRLKDQLEGRSRDAAYDDARAAEAEAAATAGRVLQEALTARLAADILGRAMESVETAGGSEMLGRIGVWFRDLTAGAYARITTQDGDDGNQVLVAVHSDRPDETKLMHQLSEGTRDQLYLALRLEAVAAHPDRLQFIADDILQTFDDTRAAAALDALLELSERVQVIVLTHHGHILELARRLPAGQVWECGLC